MVAVYKGKPVDENELVAIVFPVYGSSFIFNPLEESVKLQGESYICCDCRVSLPGTASIHGSFRSSKQLFVLLISVFKQEHRWVLLLQGFGPFASQRWGSALFLWHSSGGYSEARKTHSVQIILLLRKSVTWQAFIYIP